RSGALAPLDVKVPVSLFPISVIAVFPAIMSIDGINSNSADVIIVPGHKTSGSVSGSKVVAKVIEAIAGPHEEGTDEEIHGDRIGRPIDPTRLPPHIGFEQNGREQQPATDDGIVPVARNENISGRRPHIMRGN